MPCPPSLLDPTPSSLVIDVAVVGAGPAGAATAWHLARRGLSVVLLERRAAGEVWRAAGPAPWTDADLPARIATDAARLWRQVEQATGAALLHVNGGIRQVRADQATAGSRRPPPRGARSCGTATRSSRSTPSTAGRWCAPAPPACGPLGWC